jgi:hypothetical protein
MSKQSMRLIQNPLHDQLLGILTCTDTPRNLDQKWVLNKPPCRENETDDRDRVRS